MNDRDAILARLDRLEGEIHRHRRRAAAWRLVALAGLGLVLGLPGVTDAGKPKASFALQSPDGHQEAQFTALGFEYRYDGEARAKFDVGKDFHRFTFYRQDGSPSISLGTDDLGSSVRVYSPDGTMRAELADDLSGKGAGLRLYDEDGKSRMVLFSGHHQAVTGLQITDDDRQPRIELTSEPGGEAVIRATDSDAKSVTEMSVLHQSDATYRQLGFVPEMKHDPLVPMFYLLDPTGTSKLIMANPPR